MRTHQRKSKSHNALAAYRHGLQAGWADRAKRIKAVLASEPDEDRRRAMAELVSEWAAITDRRYPDFDRKAFLDACGL